MIEIGPNLKEMILVLAGIAGFAWFMVTAIKRL